MVEIRALLQALVAGFILSCTLSGSAVAGCLEPFWKETKVADIAPRDLASADLNGDGKPDLVGSDALTLFALINTGSMTFAAPVTLYSGSPGRGIIAADYNGDGFVDLVIADKMAPAIITLLNDGTGHFAAPVSTPIDVTPTRITGGDFNGDGKPDVILFSDSTNVVVAYVNNGNGSFTEKARSPIAASPTSVATGDLDGDGHLDIAITHSASTNIELFYGTADAALGVPVYIAARPNEISVAIADMANAGFRDLVAIDAYTIAVFRNLSGRTFGYPLTYTIAGMPFDLLIGDFTGDNKLDAIVAEDLRPASYRGYGDGTLGTGRPWYPSNYRPYRYSDAAAAADFDGDGRLDWAVAGTATYSYTPTSIWAMQNLCGDDVVSITLESPILSVGQTANVTVLVGPPPNALSYPLPTGKVTLLDGSQPLQTLNVTPGGSTIFQLTGLAASDHSLTATYAGDEQYLPRTSDAVVQHVTADMTTLTITPQPSSAQYGIPICLTATLTFMGQPVAGQLRAEIDGQVYGYGSVSSGCAYTLLPPVGSHTVTFRYLGDATHPPSNTVAFPLTVTKSPVTLRFQPSSTIAGQNTYGYLTLAMPAGFSYPAAYPHGTASIQEGSTQLVSTSISSTYAYPTLPGMAAGRHTLHITYSGDSNFEAAALDQVLNVFLSGSNTLDARGSADFVSVTFYSALGWSYVNRIDPKSGVSLRNYTSSGNWDDTSAVPRTPYLYRVEPYDGTQFTTWDVGMRISFTDDPLVAGMAVKAIHVAEIVDAVNLLRAAAGLSNVNFDDAGAGGLIKAAHVIALRSAIIETRAKLGATAPTFTDDIVAGQTVIRAVHIQELREWVR